MRELDEVVQKTDRPARERCEQHGQPLQRVVADRQERDRRREQDHQAAHRRRALLGDVVLGPLLPDVLPELVLPQKRDELGADEDRDDQCHECRDQDSGHRAVTPARASATTSSPTDRDPFTSTASPDCTSWRASTTASAASAAQASGSYPRARGPTPITTSTFSAARPISSWKRPASSPSSAISPRIATVRRPPARSNRWPSAARIATGFAFQASLISSPPPGSSLS